MKYFNKKSKILNLLKIKEIMSKKKLIRIKMIKIYKVMKIIYLLSGHHNHKLVNFLKSLLIICLRLLGVNRLKGIKLQNNKILIYKMKKKKIINN